MDCYQDVGDVELHCLLDHLLKRDYYQDEVLALQHLLLAHSHLEPVVLEPVVLEPVVLVLRLQLLLLREMPLRHQDLHRALLLIQRQVRDQPLHSFWQRSFWLLSS